MPLRLHLDLNDATRAMLQDIVVDQSETEKTLTEERWVFRQLRQLAGNHAIAWRTIQGRGVWEGTMFNGKPLPVRLDDLKKWTLTEGQGAFTVLLGDKLVEALEHTCAVVEATNRLQGRTLPWDTANQWAERYLAETIILERAKLDNEDFNDEEKSLVGGPKPA
jgi:hypothetical protein